MKEPQSQRLVTDQQRGIVVAAILAIHAMALAWSATIHSPTYGEIPSLASGIWHWETGNFSPYRVNPPLVRMVAAIPVMWMRPKTDWSRVEDRFSYRCEFDIGEDFITANGERAFWLFTVARWGCVLFSLIGGYVCYRWAKELYGDFAAIVSVILWCSCPMVLGHGQLITTDIPAASLGVLASYCFSRWLKSPSGPQTIATGTSLGLALLTKTTWVVLLLLWPVMWLMWTCTRRQCVSGRVCAISGGKFIGMVVVAFAWINLAYAGEGLFIRLGEMHFVSSTLGAEVAPQVRLCQGANRFRDHWLADVRVPVPENYILGIDVQRRDFETGEATYFRGQWYDQGLWCYYAYAFLVKMPEGTTLVLALAIISLIRRRTKVSIVDDAVLLAPALCVMLLVSSQTAINSHFRYALPALPFIVIFASRAVAAPSQWIRLGAMICVTWSIASSTLAYPHGISYFNSTSGGRDRAPFHLLGSNIDWGQDVLLLKKWVEKEKPCRLYVALTAGLNSKALGIASPQPPRDHRFLLLPPGSEKRCGPHPGWYAVSVNRLYGRDGEFRYLRDLKPVQVIGHSIYVYHITSLDANSRRTQIGLPSIESFE